MELETPLDRPVPLMQLRIRAYLKKLSTILFPLTLFFIVGFLCLFWYEHNRLLNFYSLASNGDAPRETTLGYYYFAGNPFPQNYKLAKAWWQMAADQGYAEAQSWLGYLYWSGKGVQQNAVRSYMWFKLAARQGDDRAIHYISVLEATMSADQLAEAKHEVNAWRPTKILSKQSSSLRGD